MNKTFKELEEENKQLKEQLEYLRSNEYLNQVKWERNFNEDLVKELQERIDKAILKIKDLYNDEYISYGNKEELINILKGEDNE